MLFSELPLAGAHVVDLETITDSRGFNARVWCENEIRTAGLDPNLRQVNVIANGPAGTLRGFHWQVPPPPEAKLFRVTRGAIHDVIIDLRPESPTHLKSTHIELRADVHRMLYVPAGFAQAFQTLEDDTEVMYLTTAFFAHESGRGFRHDDPAFEIEWPLPVAAISQRDTSFPDVDLDVVGAELFGLYELPAEAHATDIEATK